MRFVCFGDIHMALRAIDRLAPELAGADAAILVGDLTNFGDPPDARGKVDAEDEAGADPHRGLDRGHHHHAAELAAQEGDAAHRRQRKTVEETCLDVAREIRTGVHRREKRALHKRDGECKGQIRIRGEPGQVRGRLEPGRVHRKQEQREDEREDDVRGLPRGAHDGSPRELTDLLDEPLAHAGSSASSGSSSSSPAPSSERPVLARKTSSSDGWWSWRFSTLRPSASDSGPTRRIRAVSRSVRRALVVGDLPFGSYQASPEQAYLTAVRFMKEGGAHCVKLEGGVEMVPQIEHLTRGGIPVMAHIGFTPQSEHALGGYRVQGRGDTASRILDDAQAI